MLASRLPGPWPVFTLLTVASQVFAVLPVCLARLRALSTRGHRVVSVALPLVTLTLLFCTLPSAVPGLVFMVVELAVVFLAPWLLIQMQRHKKQIQGPWDIATLSGLRH
jgi:phosphatidylinositol glycan class C protein